MLEIFTEGPLLIVGTRKTRLEFGATVYKAISLLYAGRVRATRLKKEIGYIFHLNNPGRKSLYIEVEYVLNKRPLLGLS